MAHGHWCFGEVDCILTQIFLKHQKTMISLLPSVTLLSKTEK